MDPLTNRLYVGAVNHLYDLSPLDLSIREHAVTGPRADSILCAGNISNKTVLSKPMQLFFERNLTSGT